MADQENTDGDVESPSPLVKGNGTVGGYTSRQCTCLWLLLLLGGLGEIANFAIYSVDVFDIAEEASTNTASTNPNNGNIVTGIIFLIWVFATLWIQVEDKGDLMLLTFGPCRWCLCGTGKEKIRYKDIKDYQISQSCFYGFGLACCTTIKLFNACSLGSFCCKHKTIKLTIKERVQAHEAEDEEDCCLEKGCFRCCCGENGVYIGKGCCFQPCCNPCNANCCMMNTVFISTNDAEGLMRLLDEKVGGQDGTVVI